MSWAPEDDLPDPGPDPEDFDTPEDYEAYLDDLAIRATEDSLRGPL